MRRTIVSPSVVKCGNNKQKLENKRYRIPKRQLRMDHPEKVTSLGTLDTGLTQTN